jgi:hypothetical protein
MIEETELLTTEDFIELKDAILGGGRDQQMVH